MTLSEAKRGWRHKTAKLRSFIHVIYCDKLSIKHRAGQEGMTEFMVGSRVSLPWHCGYFGLIIIYGAGSPVHWGMFNSISGLCPLDASRNSPVVTTKDVF